MPVDLYQDKPDQYFGYGRKVMMQFVPESVSRILEVGCGEGAFGALLKQERQVHITGIELVAEAAGIAATRLDQVICADLDDGLRELGDQLFDCVVCNDVLEHLVDPWAAVRQLHDHLRPGGYFVASIPNVRHFAVVKDLLLQGRWNYTDQGVLDRTHLRFFTRSSMRALFEQAGFSVRSMQGIGGKGKLPWKLGLLNRLMMGRLDDMRWLQFACVCQRD